MKATLIQASIIVIASVVVALVYNALSDDSLPLVRQEQQVEQVSDADLFADSPAKDEVQTEENPVQQSNTIDTATPKRTVAQQETKETEPTVQPAEKATPKEQVAQAAPKEHSSEPTDHVSKTVTYEQVKKLAADPNVLFIDARNADEYGLGHIGNAINIYTPEFEQNIPKVIALPRDKRVVVYCGGGACELSHELAAHMGNLGFQRVYVYVGGWHEWSKKEGIQQ